MKIGLKNRSLILSHWLIFLSSIFKDFSAFLLSIFSGANQHYNSWAFKNLMFFQFFNLSKSRFEKIGIKLNFQAPFESRVDKLKKIGITKWILPTPKNWKERLTPKSRTKYFHQFSDADFFRILKADFSQLHHNWKSVSKNDHRVSPVNRFLNTNFDKFFSISSLHIF